MAPEVFLKLPFTEAIDVYSFGLIIWEILSREWLFPEHSDLNVFKHAITVALCLISSFCSSRIDFLFFN